MKRLSKVLAIILVLTTILVVPVSAMEISPYASNYFMGHGAYLEEVSTSSFEVWFSVTAVGTMEKLGVDYIDIECSSDGVNWSVVKTYNKGTYTNLIASNTYYHSGHVTFTEKESGCQYRAYVSFYAKNGSGTASSGAYAYF